MVKAWTLILDSGPLRLPDIKLLEAAAWWKITTVSHKFETFPLLQMLCLQNSETARWRVRSAVSHSDFCSTQQQTWSYLYSSGWLMLFSDIVNLCCFFHLIQFSDYLPTSDIMSSAAPGRKEGGRKEGTHSLSPVWVGILYTFFSFGQHSR